jgi:hypothetical protein
MARKDEAGNKIVKKGKRTVEKIEQTNKYKLQEQ